MYENNQERPLNVFKAAGTAQGFVAITSGTAALFVAATMLPPLMPPVVIASIAGIGISAVVGWSGARQGADPYLMIFGGSIASAIALGAALGGREALMGSLLSLSFLGIGGATVTTMLLVGALTSGVYLFIGSFRKGEQ